jgi:heme-degrading monooxygenase HmoA
MAIVINLTLKGVPADAFEEVNAELRQDENPPQGLIVHLVHPADADTVRVLDVWESEEAHDAFDNANNPPAVLAQVLARRGLGRPQLVGRDVFEAQALVRGRPTIR